MTAHKQEAYTLAEVLENHSPPISRSVYALERASTLLRRLQLENEILRTAIRTRGQKVGTIVEMDDGAHIAVWTDGTPPTGTNLYAETAPLTSEPAVAFEDPRVQAVYAVLCSDESPPVGEHWEGWAARRIVDALANLK